MSLRLITAVVLAFVGPLAFALELQTAIGRLSAFGAPALGLLALRAAVTALGLVAGRLLWRDDTDGWRLVRIWSIAAAMAHVATFLTPYFPSNRTPGEKRLALLVWLLAYVAWFLVAHWQTKNDKDVGRAH